MSFGVYKEKRSCMWLFWGVGIWFREGVLWLKCSLVIYNVVWKVFDLLFENSAETMTSRA